MMIYFIVLIKYTADCHQRQVVRRHVVRVAVGLEAPDSRPQHYDIDYT